MAAFLLPRNSHLNSSSSMTSSAVPFTSGREGRFSLLSRTVACTNGKKKRKRVWHPTGRRAFTEDFAMTKRRHDGRDVGETFVPGFQKETVSLLLPTRGEQSLFQSLSPPPQRKAIKSAVVCDISMYIERADLELVDLLLEGVDPRRLFPDTFLLRLGQSLRGQELAVQLASRPLLEHAKNAPRGQHVGGKDTVSPRKFLLLQKRPHSSRCGLR